MKTKQVVSADSLKKLAREVLPALTPIEAVILIQVFTETEVLGNRSAALSYGDFHKLTGLSIPPIQASIRKLIEKGILEMVGGEERFKREYRYVEPMTALTMPVATIGERKKRLA